MAITKKREARKSVRQSGWISLDGGFAARPCTVLDLSSAGAKITVDDPQAVTAKMRLAFSRDARTGRSCEVVWRRGKTLGVKFVREQKRVVRDKTGECERSSLSLFLRCLRRQRPPR